MELALCILLAGIVTVTSALPSAPSTTTQSTTLQTIPTTASMQNKCGPVCTRFSPDGSLCIQTVDGCSVHSSANRNLAALTALKLSLASLVSITQAVPLEAITLDPANETGVTVLEARNCTILCLHKDPEGFCDQFWDSCNPGNSKRQVGPGCYQVCLHFDSNGNCDVVGDSCHGSEASRIGSMKVLMVAAVMAVGWAWVL